MRIRYNVDFQVIKLKIIKIKFVYKYIYQKDEAAMSKMNYFLFQNNLDKEMNLEEFWDQLNILEANFETDMI